MGAAMDTSLAVPPPPLRPARPRAPCGRDPRGGGIRTGDHPASRRGVADGLRMAAAVPARGAPALPSFIPRSTDTEPRF